VRINLKEQPKLIISLGARTPTFSASPPNQDAALDAKIRSAPVRLTEYNQDRYRSRTPISQQIPSTAENHADHTPSVILKRLMYPVALWVGPAAHYSTWKTREFNELKRGAQIHQHLLEYLVSLLGEHVRLVDAHDREYKQMTPETKICVARYVAEGVRTPDDARDRRACETCTSTARPCVWIQDVVGIRTIVFFPLKEQSRVAKKWTDVGHWVREAK
jgi:hypothetical protein